MKIKRERTFRLFYAWFILFVGLCLTCFVGYREKMDIKLHARHVFEYRCHDIKQKIQARLAQQSQMLLSGAAMFDASHEVSRKDWRIYVKRLRLNRDLDGVQALGFSLWVKPEQLKTHEERVRKEGFPDYYVKPEGKRDAYTSIVYIEPFENRNLRAFGYDMYSESIRHTAMNQAMDNNAVILSGKVVLLQENSTDVQAGTLMYAPVYQKNKPIDTIQQRRDAIFGWVYSPFRMTDLLQNIVSTNDDNHVLSLHLNVYDGDKMVAENLLYQSDKDATNAPSLFSLETKIALYGTFWTLQFEQRQNVGESGIDFSKVWLTLGSGTLISFLLFFLLRAHIMMKINANALAQKLTTQLRESELRWRFAIEGSGDGLWDWDIENSTVLFSNRWKEMLGFSSSEIGNGLEEWEKRIHPDDKSQTIETVEAYLEGKTPFYVSEHRVSCKDGSYKWILDRGMIVNFGANEKPLRMIGTHTDITKHKQMEAELQRSNADLEQFAYAISHDMRQPLRMVTSYLSLIEMALKNQLDDDTRQFLTFALDGAKRMDSMILSLLDYSRVGQKNETLTRISSKTALDEALLFLKPEIEKSNGQIEIAGDWIDLVVNCDQLTRLFQNLIGNALKYHEEDKPPHVHILGIVLPEKFRVEIHDSGIGIEPNQIDRLFKVFSRLQARSHFEGTGVGLALCRRIIEHHGGEIGVTSEGDGKGCTFWFELPIIREEST